VGAAGTRLITALEGAGMEREQVYITNAYKLRPEGNRNPTDDELMEHRDWLVREFLDVDPKKVLVLGNVSADWMGRWLGIELHRGSWWTSKNGRKYYWAYHPAYTLYNPKVQEEFFAQVYEFFNA
jgi:DNA polymerase